MTVRELIEELEAVYNKDLPVAYEHDGEFWSLFQVDVVTIKDDREVCLVG